MTSNITPTLVLRRFFLWLLICGVSAAPSFVLVTANHGNAAGMASGILLFVVGYTWLTCTRRFETLYRKPYIRVTMHIGYGLRLLLSLVMVLAAFDVYFVITPDAFCGVLSLFAGMKLTGMREEQLIAHFGGALLLTCLQGAMMNAVVFAVMVVIYALFRFFGKQHLQPRGFEVIPLANNRDMSNS